MRSPVFSFAVSDGSPPIPLLTGTLLPPLVGPPLGVLPLGIPPLGGPVPDPVPTFLRLMLVSPTLMTAHMK